MIGLQSSEVYNSVFVITEENIKIDIYQPYNSGFAKHVTKGDGNKWTSERIGNDVLYKDLKDDVEDIPDTDL